MNVMVRARHGELAVFDIDEQSSPCSDDAKHRDVNHALLNWYYKAEPLVE
ncbi:hypothetical protein [Shewanella sp. GutCb]|nr:hypothetical protein [Shewanella sp. GutCb]